MKCQIFLFVFLILELTAKQNGKSSVIEDITDFKELKKLFRTKNNVLILFVASHRDGQPVIKTFRDAADKVKGQGTMVMIDCSNSDAKKLCKKMKITPTPTVLKHYKDGDYHKDYDRQLTVSSIVNYMRDPTGDLPWEEDPAGSDVVHIPDAMSLAKFLKRETRPVMLMFYAPWCGYCKQLKPDYSAAATELKPDYVLAAIDVNRPENSVIRKLYNITGFPTLQYYEYGLFYKNYEGENNKAAIMTFMKDPTAPPPIKPKETNWASEANSEIVHLTTANFEAVLKDEQSVMVMFYAPWCGHCKRMKPEYEKAAVQMKDQQIPGILAAVDATEEPTLGTKYGVNGYPTVKYFVNGDVQFDVNVRDAEKIVEFMKDPKTPPPPPPPDAPWDADETNVVHLTDESFKGFLKKKKHVLVMFYAPWCGHCKKAKPEFVEAADEFKDDPRIELAAIDCTKHSAICSVYDVKGYPTIKYFSYLKTVKEYTGGRTAPDFIKFLNDPDAPPEKKQATDFGKYPGSENVVILGDENFEETISKVDRALIMFYAPWCGHCNQMKPAYSAAAKRLKDDGISGIIGAVDSTAHMGISEQFAIQGFPTIKYFERGVLKSDYKGPRTADDIYNFVKSGGLRKDEL